MKRKTQFIRIAAMLIAFVSTTVLCAQPRKAKVADRDLIGVWIMQSVQVEGHKKQTMGSEYNQIKVYRENGEYACAEVVRDGDEILILPHEYGTYTMQDGTYTECGRKGTLIMVDKTHFEGQWFNRHDYWRKVSGLPDALIDYVVDKCRRKTDPKDIQALTRKFILESKSR